MDNHNSLNNDNSNDSSNIPYSKINSQEDTFLELKDIKPQQISSEQNNYNKMYNDNNNTNKDNVNRNTNNKSNRNEGPGILNRKLSEYFYRRIGNTFTFFGDKDGSPLIVIGPHWPMYICFCSLVCIGYIIFFYYFWKNMNIFIKFSGIVILLTFFISYTLTFLLNPGIPKYDENSIIGQPREKYRFCDQCKIWINMDKNTAHCFDCNVCVEGYDHHCPWTGKCIGKNNLIYFYTFLVSILFIFSFFVLAMSQAQSDMFKKAKSKRNKTNFKK